MREFLKKYKEENKLSYFVMSVDCGVAYETIYRYIKGERVTPRIEEKIKKYVEDIKNGRI